MTFKLIKLFLFKSDIIFNFKKIYLKNDLNEMINISKLILPILIISLLLLSQLNINRFIILYFEDHSSFAKFIFHIQVIELCSIFFMAIHQLSDPKISFLTRNFQKTSFKVLCNKLFNIFFSILPFLLLVIFFIINELIQILNINIKIELSLFLILSVNFCLIYFFFTIYQYLIMINERRFLIKVVFSSLLVNVILSFILTKFFSIVGLAFANLISNLFLFSICNYHTNFFFLRKKDVYKLFLSTLRFFIVIIFLSFYYKIFTYENIFITVFLKIIYISTIFLISEMLISNKYRIFYMLNSFVKIVNLNSKKNEK